MCAEPLTAHWAGRGHLGSDHPAEGSRDSPEFSAAAAEAGAAGPMPRDGVVWRPQTCVLILAGCGPVGRDSAPGARVNSPPQSCGALRASWGFGSETRFGFGRPPPPSSSCFSGFLTFSITFHNFESRFLNVGSKFENSVSVYLCCQPCS